MVDSTDADESLGYGLFFEPSSYPGFVRRTLAIVIDGIVLLIMGIVILVPLTLLTWDPETGETAGGLSLLLWGVFTWIYMTVIKRSRLRTIGYRLSGLQIVTTKGERPSLGAMTFRFMMWIFGPFNFIMDLAWLAADTENQTLRDCYAGTYVVRSNAKPIGSAPIHLTRYFANGFAPSYPRVVRPVAASPC